MPYFVSKDLQTVEIAKKHSGLTSLPELFRIIPDTEYSQNDTMTVDCVGLYSPELMPEKALIYPHRELSNQFNPIYSILDYSGLNYTLLGDSVPDELMEGLSEINEKFYLTIEGLHGRSVRKLFEQQKKDGQFDEFLDKWKCTRQALIVERIRDYNGVTYEIRLVPKQITAQIVFFFSPADLFKIWGKAHQRIILDSKLYQFRSLRFLEYPTVFLTTDCELIELKIEIRDTMYRMPPVDRSLAGQAKAFGLSGSKIDLETREIASKLGLESPDIIKENMSILFEELENDALVYNAQDIFLTDELDKIQRDFLNLMRNSFNLNPSEIADTTGKNVSELIIDLIYSHFGINPDESKDEVRIIRKLLKLGKATNLQKLNSNHFGIQPFLTVGGLLFTRMAKFPFFKGNLSDLDLISCYASIMSRINVYLGEPKVLTFRFKKYKPTLKDALKLIENENAPSDGWFVRVSGKLEKAINSLVLSDLRFTPKKDLLQEKYGLNINRKSINQFNAEKTAKKQAVSTILLKEIKFGLINDEIISALKLLPDEWYEEYLNLSVDSIVYYPGDLIVDTLEEYLETIDCYGDEPEKEELNQDKKALVTETQHYKNNVVLRFPIKDYWTQLKEERARLKKAKDPSQTVYKLVQNSGFGAFACLYLAINNPITSNIIPAMARVGCWTMLYALNGFSPITDGSCFSWGNIPIGKTFRGILEENSEYIFNFDPSIESGLDPSKFTHKWIDTEYKNHLASFYGLSPDHPLINRFGFELKEESFITKEGNEKLEQWIKEIGYTPTDREKNRFLSENKGFVSTVFFNTYINTNGANYVKGLSDSSILIDGYEFDFISQTNNIKARSYSSKRDSGLLPWFIKSVTESYESPYIYEENQVIKFGEGNDIAIKILGQLGEEIAHPMGFSTKSVKLMRLISRSQFLFLNESQLRNFETNEGNLAHLSRVRISNRLPLLSEKFWKELKSSDLADYGDELREGVDYYGYSKGHPVGSGFELLALNRNYNGSILKVRESIQTKILNGCKDFNSAFQIQRSIQYAQKFKYLLASVIVRRKNYEEDLKQILINAKIEPTILTVGPDDIQTLAKLWGYSDEEN